ncbi:MAG: YncE family protein [Candidatus Acidiferrum sp.]
MFSRTRNSFVRMAACFALVLTGLAGAVRAGAQTPSPALLVLEKSDEKLAIVDPASLKVVGRVPSGGAPHEVVASDDGRIAYISNYASERGQLKTLSVVDLTALKAMTPVDLGALRAPHGLAFADGKVYFTAEANKVIGRYDPSSNQVDWVLGTGQNVTHMIVLSKDSRTIFTSNIGSDSICVIEPGGGRNGWNVTAIPVGKGPEGFDLSPDGKEVWAANSGDGSVSIVDVASKKVTATLDLKTKRTNRLKFTPDGKLVLISDDGSGEVVVVDTASRKERKRLKVGKGPEGTLLQPDGARAYVALSGENAVAVIDLKLLEVTGKIATGNGPDGLAWAQRK